MNVLKYYVIVTVTIGEQVGRAISESKWDVHVIRVLLSRPGFGHPNSVTRWLDSFSIFGHLQQRDEIYRESILGGTKLIIVFPIRSAVDNTKKGT